MNRYSRTAMAIVLSVGCLLGWQEAARADNVTWTFQNVTRTPFVGATLYSRSRAAAWPGNGAAYSIPNDGRTYGVVIACVRDELLCHGGWVPERPNISWGVGPWNFDGCPDCCYYCREGTAIATRFDRSGCKIRQAAAPSVPGQPEITPVASRPFAVAQAEACEDLEVPRDTPTPPQRDCDKNELGWCDIRLTPQRIPRQ